MLVDYICNPSDYKVKILDFTNGTVTIMLSIATNDVAYQRYLTKNMDYDNSNKMIKTFCQDLENGNFRVFTDKEDTIYVNMAKNGLIEVVNRLGLRIWKRKKQ